MLAHSKRNIQLLLIAQNKACNNHYDKARKDYAQAAKKLQRKKEAAASLYGIPGRTHELAEHSKKIKLLTEERNLLGKQLSNYRRIINGEAKEIIDDIFKTLQHENTEKQRQSKRLYIEYLSLKKQADKYNEATQKLSTENMDTILFSDKLPARLHRKCKIDGIQPVSKLKVLVHNGDSYALLEQLPTLTDKAALSDISYSIPAVKLGDTIKSGTVPKYRLQVIPESNNKWTVHDASIQTKDDSSPELVRLYARHESKRQNTASQRPLHSVLQAAHAQKNQAILAHISSLAEKLIAKEKGVRLDVHWNDESEAKDKAKIAEEKMYQGWSL